MKNDNLLSLMKDRRSIRNYTFEPVRKEAIERIISAAYRAPSAARVQGYQIIVVDDPVQKEKIREVCEQGEKNWVFSRPEEIKNTILRLPGFSFQKKFLTEAPVLLVISTAPNKPDIPYAIESCWIAIAYMLLEIENNELGSLTYTPSICLTDQRRRLNDLLDLPGEQVIQAILPIGHYTKTPERMAVDFKYKIHHNRYNTPFLDQD
ncbi:MAG: nitroreductase family protein [Candidatus Hodarchaeales archaeon]